MRDSLCGKGKRDCAQVMASEHLELEHTVFVEVNKAEGVCIPRRRICIQPLFNQVKTLKALAASLHCGPGYIPRNACVLALCTVLILRARGGHATLTVGKIERSQMNLRTEPISLLT